MAAEQNRPARARPEVARPETQELNVDAGLGILFGTPGRKDDSFIPPLRYARNEGMIKVANGILRVLGKRGRVPAGGLGRCIRPRRLRGGAERKQCQRKQSGAQSDRPRDAMHGQVPLNESSGDGIPDSIDAAARRCRCGFSRSRPSTPQPTLSSARTPAQPRVSNQTAVSHVMSLFLRCNGIPRSVSQQPCRRRRPRCSSAGTTRRHR